MTKDTTTTGEEFEIEIFSEIEYGRLLAQFQDGIESLNKLAKKLKRKKLFDEKDQKFLDEIKVILQTREKEYFDLFKYLLGEENEIERKEIAEEMSCILYNKYGIMNKILEWELNKTYKD